MRKPQYDRMSKKALIDRLVEVEKQLRRAGAERRPIPVSRRRAVKEPGAAGSSCAAPLRGEARPSFPAPPSGASVKSASESDYTVLDRDGSIRRLYRVVKDIRDDAGNPVFSEEAFYEISRKTDTASGNGQMDPSGDSDQTELICRFRPNGDLTYVNEAYCRYFGCERGVLQSRNALLSISETDRERVYSRLKGLRPERPVDTLECRVVTVFGELLWNQWTYRALFDDSGNVLEYRSVGRDITFRKYTQDVLEKRAAILEAVTYAAEGFLKSSRWRDRIERILERFGAAMSASHVFLCENRVGKGGEMAVLRSYEWFSPQTLRAGNRQKFLQDSKLAVRFSEWVYAKSEGRPIYGSIGNFSEPLVGELKLDKQVSIAVVPILSGERWWGFIGFADYTGDIQWTEDEIAPLGAASEILGAAIEREEKEETLRASNAILLDQERFLAGIFDAIQDGIMVASPDMVILRVNKAIERRFPHIATLKGRKCHEAFYGLEYPCENCASQKTIETGESSSVIRPIVGPNGEIRGWVDVFSYPWRDHSTGVLKGVIEYSRDITEGKRAEEDLANTRTLLEQAFEQSPYPMALVSMPDAVVRIANTAIREFLGIMDEPSPVGQSLFEMNMSWKDCDPQGNPIPLEELPLACALRGQETLNRELMIVTKDGTVRHELVSGVPIRNDKGDILAGYLVCTDITERRLVDQALRASEARYRELAEHLPVGIYEADLAGTVNYANKTAMEMFGYSAGEAAGINFLTLIVPEERETAIRNMKSIREGTPLVYLEYTMFRRDGSRFPALTRSRPLFRNGRIVGSTGVVTDISHLKRVQEDLRKNEALLESILQAAPIGVGMVHNRVIAWVNEGMTALTGYEGDELKGTSARILYQDDEEFERVGRIKYADIKSIGKGAIETRWKRKDGTVIDVYLSSAPVDPANPAAGVVFTAMDITAQKKAEDILLFAKKELEKQIAEQTREIDLANTLLRIELEERRKTEKALVTSEKVYRAVVEDQTELICRFRPDGTFSFANDAFCRFFGKERNELLGRRDRLVLPEDWGIVRTALRSLKPENPLTHCEIRVECPDGKTRWTQWTDRAVYDDERHLLEHQAVGRDITDRKESELQIRESRNMLRSVFDGISDPLLMVREDMTVVMLNRSALNFLVMSQYQDAIGISCLESLRQRYGQEEINLLQSAIAGQEPTRHEFVTKGGESSRYEEVFVYPVQAGGEGSRMAIIRITDRTSQRLMERELIQSEKLASLGLLISGIVHEINNPNNFISFNIPILRDYIQEILPVLDDHAARTPWYEVQGMPYADFRTDVMKLLENVEHGSTRINTTVGKLKEFSRKKHEKGERPILPTAVVERAVAICRTQIRKMVKTFSVQVQQGMSEIVSDPDAIEQTLINLLINAAQAADKPDSRIALHAWQGSSGKVLLLEVEDNGCGMDSKTVSRIFDPFFTTKEESMGTGLGLYISKNLIESVGGSITVESEIGRGTIFRVVLPDLKDPDHREQTSEQRELTHERNDSRHR